MTQHTTITTTPTIRALAPADEARWRELFRAYREFYRLAESEEVVSRAWAWMMDPAHECSALVAEADGAVVGFAHHRRFSSPYTGSSGIFLDDLFTDPGARGRGVGRALIGRLTEMADAEGRSVVQWVTADDNHRAQALYDTLAERTRWVTYEADPVARGLMDPRFAGRRWRSAGRPANRARACPEPDATGSSVRA